MTKSRKSVVLVACLAVLVLATAVIGGALLARGGESAGPEDGVALGDVVSNPASYDGQTVTVSGEVEENRYFSPRDASLALVLGDDAGVRLLVVPDLGVDVPALKANSVVEVRGTVHALSADEPARGFVEPAGILASEGMDVLIGADTVSPTPPPATADDPLSRDATLEMILRDPRAFDGRYVTVGGQARKTERGLILSADGRDVFVSAPRDELADVQDGERITINAKVQRLSGLSARTLERQLGAFPDDPQAVLDRVPVDPGEPYLLLRGIER